MLSSCLVAFIKRQANSLWFWGLSNGRKQSKCFMRKYLLRAKWFYRLKKKLHRNHPDSHNSKEFNNVVKSIGNLICTLSNYVCHFFFINLIRIEHITCKVFHSHFSISALWNSIAFTTVQQCWCDFEIAYIDTNLFDVTAIPCFDLLRLYFADILKHTVPLLRFSASAERVDVLNSICMCT